MKRAKLISKTTSFIAGAALALLAGGCSRNHIEAINLANEGDKAKGANLEEAISKYEQATQLDPTNHRIMWKLCLALLQEGRLAEGRALVRQGGEGRARVRELHALPRHRHAPRGREGADELGPTRRSR